MRDLDRVKAAVEAAVMERKGHRKGDEIVFQCPNPDAHNNGDANPSASFNVEKGAWICHACGEHGGVLDLAKRLGLPIVDDGPDNDGRPAGVPATWPGKDGRRFRYVTHWTYRDAGGRDLGHVVRFEPDSAPRAKETPPFFKREGDRWRSGARAEPRPLFGLDLLAKARPDAVVWVVEGEKCAVALQRLGQVVATSQGGSKAARKADWGPLAGRRVTLWPDNDNPGAGYVRDVVDCLAVLHPPAEVVGIVDAGAMGLPPGGDVVDWIEAGHTAVDLASLPRLEADTCRARDRGRKEVATGKRPAFDVPTNLEDAATGLFDALTSTNTPPTLFRYSDGIAEVATRDDGSTGLRRLAKPDTLREAIGRRLDCREQTKTGYRDLPGLPRPVSETVLARPGDLVPLPIVRRIVRVPSFSRTGALLISPGYLPREEVLVDLAGFLVPDIPEAPTSADITAARDLLFELVCDFPFEGDGDRAAWLATTVTFCCRELFDGPAPLFAFEASTPGAGKGLLADLALLIMGGAGARWHKLDLAPRDEKENQQRVLATLAGAPPAIMLDNLPDGGIVSSPALASVLTSTSHSGRMLGETRHVAFPNAATWVATGNNLRWSTELTARIVPCRLRATRERPRERTGFRQKLPDWASENRPRLVAAVLTLVRGWIVAGRRPGSAVMGSFQGWASVVSGILEHAGIDALLANRDQLFDRADDEGTTWRPFVQAWAEAYATEPVAVGMLATLSEDRELLGDLLRGDTDRGRATALGKLLRRYEGRIFGAWRIGRVRRLPGHCQGCALEATEGTSGNLIDECSPPQPRIAGGAGEPGEPGEHYQSLHARENEAAVVAGTGHAHARRDGQEVPQVPQVPPNSPGSGPAAGNVLDEGSRRCVDVPPTATVANTDGAGAVVGRGGRALDTWYAGDDGPAEVWSVFAGDACGVPGFPMPPELPGVLRLLADAGVGYTDITAAIGRYRGEPERVVTEWRRVLGSACGRAEVAP